jgi:hypothetical protein
MKGVVPIVVVALLGYLAFVFWQNSNKPAPAAPPPPVAIATPAPTATPTPPPPLVAIAPPTPQRNLAPAGTFYIVQRVTITTDSGITGVAPGTKVTMVSPGPPMRVSDGQNEFEVQPEQVTNDLDIAARAYYADRNAQAALNASGARAAQASAAQEEATEKAWQDKERALSTLYAQPASLPMSTGELNEGPKPVSEIGGGGEFKGAIH